MDHPAFRNMHSNPNPRHCSHHLFPGTEHHPTQMFVNPIQPPINYGYAPPIPCHGCCNWGSSPCSHHIPHCFGNYHSRPPQFMPCFPIEQQPWNESEKNVPMTRGQHCCGCPNHSIVWKDNDNVDNNRVVWKDGVENGLYPLDLRNLVSSKEQVGGEESDDVEGRRRFPFPICWLPNEPKGNEKEMEKQHLSNSKEKLSLEPETSRRVKKVIEVKEVEKHKEDEGSKNQERGSDGDKKVDNGESKLSKESVKRKNPCPPKSSKLPPVCLRVDPLPKRKAARGSLQSPNPPSEKQRPGLPLDNILPANEIMEVVDGKTQQENKGEKVEICVGGPEVNQKVENHIRESIENDGMKGQSKEVVSAVGKNEGTKETSERKLSEEEADVTIQSACCGFDTRKEKNTGEKVEIRVGGPEVNEKMENNARESIENDGMKGQSEEVVSAVGKNEEGTKETSKRKLSEEEAAVTIQSAYRGFDTRRWDPVNKLKEIAKVRDQIESVKQMIQETESCSDIEGSSKQRNVISETIMSLLLKLDTIQGLHPSIRNIRKSVVKELASLQENLVSMMVEKSENSPHQEPNMRCEEDASNEIEDATKSENGNEIQSDLLEVADQNQPVGENNCLNSETPEANEVPMDAVEKEDEKGNEGLESDEISAKKDERELVLEQIYEVPISPDSSIKVADSAPSDRDELESELTDHPQEECIEKKSDVDSLITEKAIDNPPEKETFSQLLHEGVSERDVAEETKMAEKEPKNDTTGAENHEAHEENANPDARIDVQAQMDFVEGNRRLIEENEKLRGIVENLVKLGQEQLTAISGLTVRVKNLEGKLSKKNKLKVKQRKGCKIRGLVDE